MSLTNDPKHTLKVPKRTHKFLFKPEELDNYLFVNVFVGVVQLGVRLFKNVFKLEDIYLTSLEFRLYPMDFAMSRQDIMYYNGDRW